ncbi:predicted protein [Streptomyces viridosporus ATCC 14672]|uniref:Predicted protein n=1 Tax=Streptomyces viridosporus (strain ATCC 14672 / DSM 40746 / JCM 4963 / KCTC 9882 / NRRL B-12104 / FH 1290) TaxID=566461 RepID=D6A6E6_STRV1|nr:predicted protein [Streptomyces viridosporus ATCC 14672]
MRCTSLDRGPLSDKTRHLELIDQIHGLNVRFHSRVRPLFRVVPVAPPVHHVTGNRVRPFQKCGAGL